MVIKTTARIIAFITAVVLFISLSEPVLKLKNYNAFKFNYILYNDKRDIVNVGFFGGSHAYNAFCPNAVYNKTGIKSFTYASSGQPIFLTYYLMQEVIKSQNLEVAVVDLYYLGLNTEYFEHDGYLHNVIDNMKLSKNKISAIQNCIASNDRMSYYLPFIKYHTRWSELTAKDLKSSTGDKFLLGWNGGSTTFGNEFNPLPKDDTRAPIPEKSLKYLNLIIELCEENNIKLLFTSLPHDYINAGRPGKWIENEYAMFNTVKDLLKEKGIDFILFNQVLDEINFNTKVDMFNSGHVNINGAVKVSEYLADYIAANYHPSVIDEKNNQKWQSYYQKFLKYYKSLTSS